jgi:hypothetical protein
MGVSRPILVRAEGGQSISLPSALKIAAFYERPVEELFSDLVEQAA